MSALQLLAAAVRPALGAQARASSTYACSKWVTDLTPAPSQAHSNVGPDEARQANNINKWLNKGVSETTVTVYSPQKNCMQSGLGNTADGHPQGPVWKVAFPAQPIWENPLMGWASTADPYEFMGRNSHMSFNTKEAAIAWASKMGFKYEVREPQHRNMTRSKRFAAYADNFSMVRKGEPDLSTYPSNNGFGWGEKGSAAPAAKKAAPKKKAAKKA